MEYTYLARLAKRGRVTRGSRVNRFVDLRSNTRVYRLCAPSFPVPFYIYTSFRQCASDNVQTGEPQTRHRNDVYSPSRWTIIQSGSSLMHDASADARWTEVEFLCRLAFRSLVVQTRKYVCTSVRPKFYI